MGSRPPVADNNTYEKRTAEADDYEPAYKASGAKKTGKAGKVIGGGATAIFVGLAVIGSQYVRENGREQREATQTELRNREAQKAREASRAASERLRASREDRRRLSDPTRWTDTDLVGTWRIEPYLDEFEGGSVRLIEGSWISYRDGSTSVESRLQVELKNDPLASGEYLMRSSGNQSVSNGELIFRNLDTKYQPDPRYRSDKARWNAMSELAGQFSRNVPENPEETSSLVETAPGRITEIYSNDDGATTRVTSIRVE